MSDIDISTIAVSKTFNATDYSNTKSSPNVSGSDILTSDLLYPKQGMAFNYIQYYGSKTDFQIDGSNMIARTDGDPYPAKCGSYLGYTTVSKEYLYNDVATSSTYRKWYDDPNLLTEQSDVYTFTYRGGTNTSNPQVLYNDGGINGMFVNGVSYLAPLGGQSLVSTAANTTMKTAANFQLNAYYFIKFLGKDAATGHPEEKGEYHYHTGAFLYSAWNNSTFYNSNTYYSDSSYSLVGKTVTYDKTVFSDDNAGLTDHMRFADGHSKIVGMCFDGYPIYGPFGYTNSTDATGGVQLMTSGYVVSSTPVTSRPYSYTDTVDLSYFIQTTQGHHSYYNKTSDASKSKFTLGAGAYVNDYVYNNGTGTLDSYNGRYTKTPDYPNGTYAYFITVDASGTPQYPYIVGNSSKQQRSFTTATTVYCTITASTVKLYSGETTTITFTMNKDAYDFAIGDITVTGGTLSSLSGQKKVYTATFTPTTSSTTAGSIIIDSLKYADSTSNKNYKSNTLLIDIDTTRSRPIQSLSFSSYSNTKNALQINSANYVSPAFRWSKASSYYGTYTTESSNTNLYRYVSSSDAGKFIKAEIKSSTDSTYSTVAIIYIAVNYIGIVLDSSVTYIGASAFTYGSGTYSASDGILKIANIFIPKSVTTIGTDAFKNFTGKIYIETGSSFNAKSSVFPSTATILTSQSVSSIISKFTRNFSNVSNSPVEGAKVFYVDNDGVMLDNSPIAYTDYYGDFDIATYVDLGNGNYYDFTEDPLKITGGKNTLTGQTITYWNASWGTKTMTPITNLLFYCTAEGALTNDSILSSLPFQDPSIDFSNYNYYKTLVTTSDTRSITYTDSFIANNLGNSINIFATNCAYFLYAINGTTLDEEYDAAMRSIANISTDNNGVNEFAQLFGTESAACISIITDRLKNKITNSNLDNSYRESFANAMAQQISGIITTVMGSTDFDTTGDYEIIGYAVVQNVYDLTSTIQSALANSANDKSAILSYFTKNIAFIYRDAIQSQLFKTNNSYPGYLPVQTINNTRASDQVMMRRILRDGWNTSYASGVVNGASRVVTPFRAVNNLGDFLGRENYVCGGPNQVNASKPGWKSRIGSIISNCDFTNIPSSTCNVKYVPDASDYIKYRKLRATSQNYYDSSNGGDDHNASFIDLMRVRRR